MMTRYDWGTADLEDPDVFALLQRNHVPRELSIRSASGPPLTLVQCEQDDESWPCRVKVTLDETDEPSRFKRR